MWPVPVSSDEIVRLILTNLLEQIKPLFTLVAGAVVIAIVLYRRLSLTRSARGTFMHSPWVALKRLVKIVFYGAMVLILYYTLSNVTMWLVEDVGAYARCSMSSQFYNLQTDC